MQFHYFLHKHSTLLQMSLLLLLLLSILMPATCLTEAELEARTAERLNWLTVTKPDATNVQINCKSRFEYPFSLLENNTDSIGVGRPIRRMWWVFPDRSLIMPGYNDGNRRISSEGSVLTIDRINEAVQGLYHCVAEAEMINNSTVLHVYYYKRGLNLYGADIYNNLWEKYRINLLTGVLTSGSFLALVATWVLVQKSGILKKWRGASVAAVSPDDAAVATAVAADDDERKQKMEMSASGRTSASGASLRSSAAAYTSAV